MAKFTILEPLLPLVQKNPYTQNTKICAIGKIARNNSKVKTILRTKKAESEKNADLYTLQKELSR